MENMALYERFRSVPLTAQKEIKGGRLKGMTDINPMWRIQILTEAFGPCGIGWATEILSKQIISGSDGQQVAVVDVSLRYKLDGEWSQPLVGTGGSMLVAAESKALYTSDEAYKMAYTDALSVCCKMLGIGADVYWGAGRSKYDTKDAVPDPICCGDCGSPIQGIKAGDRVYHPDEIVSNTTNTYGTALCWSCACRRRHDKSAV